MDKTDYTVIGKYRNKEKTQALVEAIRAKGKTCYDFAAKPANPHKPDDPAEDQMSALESHPDFLNDPIHHRRTRKTGNAVLHLW